MDYSHDSEEETADSIDASAAEETSTTDSSSAASFRKRRRRGPSKNHPVWEHFNEGNGQSECTLCSYTVRGFFPTTLLNHLFTHHRKEHKNVVTKKTKEEKEREDRERVKQGGQSHLNFPIVRASTYSTNSLEKKTIDEALAIFAGTTSFAYHLVENEEFIDFVSCLNAKYKLPSRETLKKFASTVAEKIRANVKELLASAGKVAICADIWTQKSMTAAYLAITAHFFCQKTGRVENVCLAVKLMTASHTAEYIKQMSDEVLAEYGISDEKISRFRTDNGSNMVAAFRESLIQVWAMVVDKDFTEPTAAQVDLNLDESFDEFAQFEQHAQEFRRVFPKWLDCVAHSLQLPLRKVIDNDPALAAIRSEVFILLNKFSKSERATRMLKDKCGKKLISPGLTRWNTLCLTYDRLLLIRNAVDQVCIERNWATLGELYLKIETLRDLLKPFLDFTNFLQGEQYTTISSVIPILLNILIDLESPEPGNRWQLLGNVPILLAAEIRLRFSHVIGFQDREVGFDSTYLISTFLDPNTAYLLSPMEQKLAKRELLIMIFNGSDGDQHQQVETDQLPDQPVQPVCNRPISRFSRLAQVASATHRLEEEIAPLKSDEEEVDGFMSKFTRKAPTVAIDAISFWKNHAQEFPKLSSLAFDLLAIPATSAAVERVFSQAGLATAGRKCQTGPALLELECMMKYNKRYYVKNR